MNIGFFSPTINKIGGGELVTLHMIKALQNRGHDVTIASYENIEKERIEHFLGDSLKYKELIIKPNLFDPYALQNIYPNLLKSLIFKMKCDYLIDPFSNSVLPWLNAVYFQGIPWFVMPSYGLSKYAFAPYKLFLKDHRSAARSNDPILITCSNFVAKTITRSTGYSVNVLNPPVSDFFKFTGDLSTKTDDIVTVTRISRDKQPKSLIDILKLLPESYTLTIVGSCMIPQEANMLYELKQHIARLGLQKRVKLVINVSRTKQKEILQNAKIYLHPFVKLEAFGISVTESMYAGCVPVVPDFGGPKEIVKKELRYTSIEQAAEIVTNVLASWTEKAALEAVNSAKKYSKINFERNLVEILGL